MKKVVFLLLFFEISQKTAETILMKKIERNHGTSVYKKVLISEYRRNYFFRDITVFSRCLLVSQSVILYVTHFCGRASSKRISKPNFPRSFGPLRLRVD